MKGERIVYRGEFARQPRCSLFCFPEVNGKLDYFSTEETFDRLKFVNFCRNFALRSGKVFQYPGYRSVWILDGGTIHPAIHSSRTI
jgi:hypothetical protein